MGNRSGLSCPSPCRAPQTPPQGGAHAARDFPGGVRVVAGAAGWCLRDLREKAQPRLAVRRSLPPDRQDTRLALRKMQLRPGILRRRPEPHARRDRLSPGGAAGLQSQQRCDAPTEEQKESGKALALVLGATLLELQREPGEADDGTTDK